MFVAMRLPEMESQAEGQVGLFTGWFCLLTSCYSEGSIVMAVVRVFRGLLHHSSQLSSNTTFSQSQKAFIHHHCPLPEHSHHPGEFVHPSPPSSSRTFTSPQRESLYPLRNLQILTKMFWVVMCCVFWGHIVGGDELDIPSRDKI